MEDKGKRSLNTNSNTYIIMYATVMVIAVAFILAFVSSYLKPVQDTNVMLDKKKQILAALNINGLEDKDVAARYADVVEADMIIDSDNNVVRQGEKGGERDGFALNSSDFKKGRLAVYVCRVDGGVKYVVPVYGMGLWGPISGYIGIDSDRNTVYGAYFTHESETAGLGAEIKDNKAWQQQFRGKKIMKEGTEGIAGDSARGLSVAGVCSRSRLPYGRRGPVVSQLYTVYSCHCRNSAVGGDDSREIFSFTVLCAGYISASDSRKLRHHGCIAVHAAAYRA